MNEKDNKNRRDRIPFNHNNPSHDDHDQDDDGDNNGNRKQSVHVTRSDPLTSTCPKSHLIRSSKHQSNNHQHFPYSSHPTSFYSNHPSKERRARWIRERMSANNHNYQHPHENMNGGSHNYKCNNHCCGEQNDNFRCHDRHQHRCHIPHCPRNNNSSEDCFEWTKFSCGSENWCNGQSGGDGGGSDSVGNWISDHDSKESRFHRPYSVREQRPWTPNQHRLRTGLSLPSQNSLQFFPSIKQREEVDEEERRTPSPNLFLKRQLSSTRKRVVVEEEVDNNIQEDGEEEDDDEEEEDEEDDDEQRDNHSSCYLSRQTKLPYPYRLKSHHHCEKIEGGDSHNLAISNEEALQRRSRSGSSCSITSESTIDDCENTLDPPLITPPHGDIHGGPTGSAVPVTRGVPGSYGFYSGTGAGSGARKFSILFASHDAWNEENIIQSFKELSPTATAIFEAAWTGNVKKLEEILKSEENVEKLRDPGPTGFRDGDGRTPLHLASACGHVNCVELLVQKGAYVNATDANEENKATPLSCAASCGSVPVVKALLAAGANANEGYEQGKTALHWAIQCGSVECAKEILEAGAKQNPPQVYSETPLHVSASQGDPKCLQLLLDYGADVNLCKGTNRSTALHLSSEEGSSTCVRLLLKHGASHTVKDIRGHAALHVAATCDADCVIALLKAGADPNAVDANGRTPLHCAVARGSRAAECVRLLVESGADIDAQDNYGYTPLHLSAVNESSQCASILLHHGSDVTLKTNAGTTALSLLVRRIPDVMRYLVERLDSAVSIHDHDPADPDCEVRLDFRAIVPNCEKKHGNVVGNGKHNGNGHVIVHAVTGGNGGGGGSDKRKHDYFSKPHKETEFLTCLVGAGNKKILAHPLSEAFLTLKWRRVRKFFWASLLFQIALVALFTIYVVEVYLIRCPYRRAHFNNESAGGGVVQHAVNILPPPSQPPEPSANNDVTGAHNVTRRSADPVPESNADAEAGFQWFGLVPPPKWNRTRSSKQSKPENADHSPTPPQPAPPTQRSTRGRVNIIIGHSPTPALAAPTPPSQPVADGGETSPNRNPRMEPIHCKLSPALQIVWILLVAFASMMGIKEIFQLIQSPVSYVKSSENWGQWLLISSVSVSAWTSPEFQLEYWQYPAAACGIFLAWGLMLLQVGRFPALGLYVQMLGKVAANFGLFILAYACLLIAFALAFCVLFPEHPPYSSVILSILKVFTMMVGEVDYEDLFYNDERLHDPILFPLTAHVLYGAFVVIVTIVLMNLLVGLAVHDIQGLQKGAKLNRLSRQTALISRLESFIFSKKLQTILPRSVGSLLQKSALLVPSSYNWSYYFRPNDPRDKRLPKDIKLASLRLAAARHSCKSKSSHSPHHHPSSQSRNFNHSSSNNNTQTQYHRNVSRVTSSITPIPIIRPISSVSHHHTTSALLPHHPEIAMRRVEQRLDHLQNNFDKAFLTLNGRVDAVLEAIRVKSFGQVVDGSPSEII